MVTPTLCVTPPTLCVTPPTLCVTPPTTKMASPSSMDVCSFIVQLFSYFVYFCYVVIFHILRFVSPRGSLNLAFLCKSLDYKPQSIGLKKLF